MGGGYGLSLGTRTAVSETGGSIISVGTGSGVVLLVVAVEVEFSAGTGSGVTKTPSKRNPA